MCTAVIRMPVPLQGWICPSLQTYPKPPDYCEQPHIRTKVQLLSRNEAEA